jgi:hypothetical protein
MAEQVILGEQDTSRATNVRRQINKLIKQANTSDFDLAELFFEANSKMYWQGWGYDSFSKWAKDLDIKYTKCYYLLGIQTVMNAVGLTRAEFEPVGKAKMRMIQELSKVIDSDYKGTPMKLLVRELTLKATDLTPDEVRFEVDALLGLTAEESLVWMNTKVKKLAKDNVIVPAYRKARRFLGQQKDEKTGEFKDASDGQCLEMICANFLTDPNYDTPDDEATNEPAATEAEPTTTEAVADAEPGQAVAPETTTDDSQYQL